MDRLRRELSMMRRERDDLVSEVKQLRAKLRIKDDSSKKVSKSQTSKRRNYCVASHPSLTPIL